MIADRVLQRYASQFVLVYHGTNRANLSRIQSQGLISPKGYDSGKWYMVAEDFESARDHGGNADENDEVNPVILQFRVPTEPKKTPSGEDKHMWPGFPYLWKPYSLTWKGGEATRWYALRQPLPPEFIVKILKP